MRKSYEYRMHRRAGLMLCRKYRARIRECARGSLLARKIKNPEAVDFWRASTEDWARRLHTERLLLAALRSGGAPRWRATVVELRPRGTTALLGLDSTGEGVTMRYGRDS